MNIKWGSFEFNFEPSVMWLIIISVICVTLAVLVESIYK